jgi:hypothetical protein
MKRLGEDASEGEAEFDTFNQRRAEGSLKRLR